LGDNGIGSSRSPDIHNRCLLEDRATCRIATLHVANWLEHGLVTKEQVRDSFVRMARKVDIQNKGKPGYVTLIGHMRDPAFQTALELTLTAASSVCGYVESDLRNGRKIGLHPSRLQVKKSFEVNRPTINKH